MRNLYKSFPLIVAKFVLYSIVCVTIISLNSCKDKSAGEETAPLATSKTASTFDASLATYWTQMQLHLIKSTPGYAAPVAARTLGYTSLALYESIVYGMKDYQSLAGQINGLTTLPKPDLTKEYNWGLAANASISTLIKEMYFTTNDANKAAIDSLRRTIESTLRKDVTKQEVTDRSITFGADIAKAIWEYAKKDGGHEGWNNNFPITYQIPTAIGSWEPTTTQKIPLLPYWGSNRNFSALNSTSKPLAPLAFSFKEGSVMYLAAKEVHTTNKALTAEQKAIANFWSDASITPAGHHFNIASIILKKEKAKLDKAVEVYLRLGLALNDAMISSWKSKYTYNLMTPFTYIKQAIDPKWSPLLASQPVPEYTSEQATSSAVASTILISFFGDKYGFTDNTYEGTLPGRVFKTFDEYTNEATIASLYAGTHYKMSNENGQKNGKEIAQNILKIKFKK